MQLTDLIIPVVFAGVIIFGFVRKVDVFSVFCDGAAEGLRTTADILPALILLLVSVGMLRASGAVTLLTELLSPLCGLVGFPPECMQMVLLRPFSGSGALAVAGDIFTACGADSPAGRTAAVMLGSTETTFYVLSVYFGAAGVRKTRHAVPAALCADLAGFLAAAFCVNVLHL